MALDVGTRGGHSARQGRSFARGLRPEYLGPHGDWAVGVDWVAQVLALTLLKAERRNSMVFDWAFEGCGEFLVGVRKEFREALAPKAQRGHIYCISTEGDR